MVLEILKQQGRYTDKLFDDICESLILMLVISKPRESATNCDKRLRCSKHTKKGEDLQSDQFDRWKFATKKFTEINLV